MVLDCVPVSTKNPEIVLTVVHFVWYCHPVGKANFYPLKCEEERKYVNESNKKNYLVVGSRIQLSAVLCFKPHVGISGFTSESMGRSGM